MDWKPIIDARRDGRGLLCYGIHDEKSVGLPGVARGVEPGFHWWAILVFDVWRQPHQWVFAKDGAPAWTAPLAFAELTVPSSAVLACGTLRRTEA